MTLTPAEAVEEVLRHIERQAHPARTGGPSQDLLRLPELPLTALAQVGSLTRLDDPSQRETLPSLLVENRSGQVQIEFCPFGPLALLTSDGDMDTDPVAQTLADAEILPLFPGDLDSAAPWHGRPLSQWLFPRRLGDALVLFDTLP